MPDRDIVIKGLETIKQYFGYGLPMFDSYYGILNDAITMLKEQPEIVRCKYCEYLSYPANGVPFCKRIKNFVDVNWFCADGKKAVK